MCSILERLIGTALIASLFPAGVKLQYRRPKPVACTDSAGARAVLTNRGMAALRGSCSRSMGAAVLLGAPPLSCEPRRRHFSGDAFFGSSARQGPRIAINMMARRRSPPAITC